MYKELEAKALYVWWCLSSLAGDGSEWKAGGDVVPTEPGTAAKGISLAHIMGAAEGLLYGGRSPTRTEAARLAGMGMGVCLKTCE
jgi:hypothetical protein